MINVLGVDYNAYLVEPDTKKVDCLFTKTKEAKVQVWITADERRMPVMIKSAVFIGSFTGELIPPEQAKEESLKENKKQLIKKSNL